MHGENYQKHALKVQFEEGTLWRLELVAFVNSNGLSINEQSSLVFLPYHLLFAI